MIWIKYRNKYAEGLSEWEYEDVSYAKKEDGSPNLDCIKKFEKYYGDEWVING